MDGEGSGGLFSQMSNLGGLRYVETKKQTTAPRICQVFQEVNWEMKVLMLVQDH